jgi:catechol 2,3-dioxygenase-like lactoylglutathione lyase family enzyme
MIDHISVAVRDLVIAERFYIAVLASLGLSKVREFPDAAIGLGRKYPEFWINKREAMERVADDSGVHICLRAPDVPSVDTFHAAALKAGGASDGDPGVRMHYDEGYYAAFIRDPDGNRIEAVRFFAIESIAVRSVNQCRGMRQTVPVLQHLPRTLAMCLAPPPRLA